jgi:hypothetical protein
MVSLTGSYSATTNLTTFTLPYTIGLTDTGWEIINPTTGRPLVGTAVATTSTLTVQGDYSSGSFYIGKNYEMRVELSKFYLKDSNGQSIISGRLQVRTLSVNYKDTGYFTVEITPFGRDTLTQEFTGAIVGVSQIGAVNLHNGEQRFLVMGRNTSTKIEIVNDSYLPCQLQTGNWEALYHPRARAV